MHLGSVITIQCKYVKKKNCTVKVYFDNIYIGHILPNIALKPHAVLRINDLINSFR